ncbi:vitamin K epoxide reductase family protein [Cellulophaga lytica]|uniref:vitamin K epoxide reductase family protein n=1 Tax=Cellulophaga lytica TaxID=979 RepID=UPI003CE5252B
MFTKKTITNVIYELFKQLDIHITKDSIENKLLKHPEYPSLISLTQTLESLGLTNKAIKVTKEHLFQIQTPFLVTTNKKEIFLIKKINGSYIFTYSSDGWQKIKLKKFDSIWNNYIVLVDTELKIKEKDYRKKKIAELTTSIKFPLLILSILLITITVSYSIGFSSLLIYYYIKIVGLIISLFLINKEINKNVNYKICSLSKKINCNDILNSSASKVFGVISMTDIAFIYFIGTLLTVTLSTLTNNETRNELIYFLNLLSFLSIPYTIFSIIYQSLIFKKWCSLCILTILVLWAESIIADINIVNYSSYLYISINSFIILMYSFTTPIIFWAFSKDILIKYNKYNIIEYPYERLINNRDIFNFLLSKQVNVNMDFQPYEIILGNKSIKNTITILIDPYCHACEKEYDLVLQLLEKHSNFAKVILRFAAKYNVNDQIKNYTTLMLTSHYLNNPAVFKELLKTWFQIKNFDFFSKNHPTKHNPISEIIVKNNYNWSFKNNVLTTPTLYLNSKKLPKEYNLKKLISILDFKTNSNSAYQFNENTATTGK